MTPYIATIANNARGLRNNFRKGLYTAPKPRYKGVSAMERDMNGLDVDDTGFGFRSGAIYRNDSTDPEIDGWHWCVGSERPRGPFPTKAEARADANRYLQSLEGMRQK